MAIVSYVLGDCPGCGRKDSFGNIEVINGRTVSQGCKKCNYTVRIPLPKLKKKVVYLDQFFFSHAFRGREKQFIDAAARIESASALQLLVAPYSSIHEDETHLWSGRDKLFHFIKAVAHGHKFRYAQEVHRIQLLRAFEDWRSDGSAVYQNKDEDALHRDVHGWDSYLRIEVGHYMGDVELIRSLKNESVEGLVGLFDGWRKLKTTFEEDLQAEYQVAAKAHLDYYLHYLTRIASEDYSAMESAPVITMVVQSMIRQLLRQGTLADDCLPICEQFLMQSKHFKQTPHQLLSARMHATMKSMVKRGNFTNKVLAHRKFNGYFYDVEHISTFAPYCDAFVMDPLMAELVQKSTVDLEKRYGTKVFSLNNWPEFLEWLDNLEQEITPEHQAGLAVAYPGRTFCL